MEENIVKPIKSETPAPENTVAESVVAEEPKVEVDAEVDESHKAGDMTIPSDPYYTDPLFYEVASYFGIQQEDYSNAKNPLSIIVDWAILEGKSNKMEDILTTIRQAEDKITPPAWGEKRYNNLHKYIRLASKKQSIQKAMSAFERNAHE